jgi:hypothetical protein
MLAYLLLSSCSFALPIPKTSSCKIVRGHEVQGHASAHVQTSSSDEPVFANFCLEANNEVSVRIQRPKDYLQGELTFGAQRLKGDGELPSENPKMKCKRRRNVLGLGLLRLGKTICSIKVAVDTEAKYVLTYNSKSRIRDVEFVWNPETARPETNIWKIPSGQTFNPDAPSILSPEEPRVAPNPPVPGAFGTIA